MNNPFSSQDLQVEIDALKMKMMLEFGMRFPDSPGEIPKTVELSFLQNVLKYEQAHACRDFIPIKDRLGIKTVFPPATHYKEQPEKLKELNKELIDCLMANFIQLEYDETVTDEELYQFITTEIMEMPVIRQVIPGYFTVFMYDEFHFNVEKELKYIACENVIKAIYSKQELWNLMPFASQGLFFNDRNFDSRDNFAKFIHDFKNSYEDIEIEELDALELVADEKQGVVKGKMQVVLHLDREQIHQKGDWEVGFECDETGIWNAKGFQFTLC